MKALQNTTGPRNVFDISFRFGRLLSQIQGLKHNVPAFSLVERFIPKIENFRNIFQHLNTHISSVNGETNPILGVLSWVSKDSSINFSATIGTQPAAVNFSSIPFQVEALKFSRNLVFSAGDVDIDLDKMMQVLSGGNEYLNEWLVSKNRVSDIDLRPTFTSIGAEDARNIGEQSGYKFIRITMKLHDKKTTS